jgi:hypothetical protein
VAYRSRVEHILPLYCARVGCSATFMPLKHGKRTKRFCSARCRVTHFYRQKHGSRSRIAERYECRHGHEKTPDNVYVNPSGAVECLACRRFNNREFHRKARGTLPENFRGAGRTRSEYSKTYHRGV